jgi:hypothetical protein
MGFWENLQNARAFVIGCPENKGSAWVSHALSREIGAQRAALKDPKNCVPKNITLLPALAFRAALEDSLLLITEFFLHG